MFEFKMSNRFKAKYVGSFVLILFLSLTVCGQDLGTGNNESCESNKLMLHLLTTLRGEVIKKYPEKDYNMPIIVIVSLGTNETNPKYNLQRLKEARTFLWRSGTPNELIITAQGEKMKGQGKVDFYFDGILQYSITLKRNQYLNLVRGGRCDLG